MPTTDWYLKPYNTQNHFLRVLIDPTKVYGARGTFGPSLLLPYEVPEGTNGRLAAELLSLEGWIGWYGDAAHLSKLRIPAQAYRAHQPQLEVPITDEQIEAIEQKRNGGNVLLSVTLAGLAVFAPPVASQSATQPAAPRAGQPAIQPAPPVYVSPVPVHNYEYLADRHRTRSVAQGVRAARRWYTPPGGTARASTSSPGPALARMSAAAR